MGDFNPRWGFQCFCLKVNGEPPARLQIVGKFDKLRRNDPNTIGAVRFLFFARIDGLESNKPYRFTLEVRKDNKQLARPPIHIVVQANPSGLAESYAEFYVEVRLPLPHPTARYFFDARVGSKSLPAVILPLIEKQTRK